MQFLTVDRTTLEQRSKPQATLPIASAANTIYHTRSPIMSNITARFTVPAALRMSIGALLLGMLLFFAAPPQPAAASCGGTTPVGDETELNNAIAAFNAVAASPCPFTIELSGDINLIASTTAINNATGGVSLVIKGDGHAVDGQDNAGVRPFEIAAGTVTMNRLTVTGGNMGGIDDGGGILNSGGNLTLNNATVTGNTADTGGGGIYNGATLAINQSTVSNNTGTDASANGGGIANVGTLTIYNSTVSGNTAVNGGGISNIAGALTLNSVTIAANTANSAGAGLYTVLTPATLKNSILADNIGAADCELGPSGSITDDGYNLVENPGGCILSGTGSIINTDPALGPLADNGGDTETHTLLTGSPAIDAGDTLEVTDQRGQPRPFGLADDMGAFELQTCFVDNWSVANEAELNAAIACYNTKTVAGSYTITLTQDILLSDRQLDRSTTAIDNDTAGVALVIEGSGFAVDGQNNFDVRPFTVQADTTVTMNDLTATGGNVLGGGGDNRGGGILNRGNLTLNRSTVISNTAETRGGGLSNQGGTVEISESTIAYNISGTSSNPGNGAGIYNENGPITISNSTISGNESVGGLSNNPTFGGGITSNDNLTLESVTVADNFASTGGGLYFNAGTGSITIKNTILATNGTDDCHFQTTGSATFNDLGHNLVLQDSIINPCGIVNGVNNNIVADPQLLPLADNGGALTHAFRLDSPAIDAGDTSLTTDQRGVARPQDLADDIGALESTICGNDSWGVRRITELNAAIECFNVKTAPGIYTISILDGGWPANLSTTAINNSTPGVSLVIEGNGSTIDRNGDLFPGTRPFLIEADTTVTINDLFISNGDVRGTERGGAIRNLGNLTINRSTIAGSRAENSGGGISNLGVLEINDSTIFANQIQGGSAGVSGGGINSEGSLTIRNSTISGNTSSNDGGGISSSGTLTLDSVTVTANSAAGAAAGSEGAGLQLIGFSTATIQNSILAGNLGAEDCSNLFSTITDNGHNLVQTQDDCGFADGVSGNIVGQSANLGPLRDNGGPTRTHALLPRSPAINAGDTTLTTDQRGELRPAGGADDIGAYEYQRASITIVKDAAPESDDLFNFLTNIGGSGSSFSLKDNGSDPNFITYSDLPLSTGFDVTEQIFQLPAGWVFDSILCSGGNDIDIVEASGSVLITLSAGEDVTCTFSNKKVGTVIIKKSTVPSGGNGFTFGGDLGDFTLNDNGSKTIPSLAPGTYAVSENDPSGLNYELSGLTCVDGDPNGVGSTGDVASRTATINLDPDETVTCTFTNTEDDTITVEKVTVPPTSDSFGFGGTLGAFDVAAGTVKGFTNQSPGPYTISEDDPAPAGYALTDISCVDSATGQVFPGDLTSRSVDLNLTPGERVHCTFTNTQLGTVIIKKATAPGGGSGFSFGGDLGDFSLDDGGSKVVANLMPGSYAVSENDPSASSYELSGLSCADSVKGGKRSSGDVGSRTASINLDPGETVTCTFTNSEDDTITVEKVTIPASSDSFGFDGGSLGAFSVAGGSVKDFTGLSAGQYTISEDDPAPAGYALTGISCVDSASGQTFPGDLNSRSVDLNLTAGERVHCTFTNTKLGTVIINKATAPSGGSGFSFGGSLGDFSLDDGGEKMVGSLLPGSYAVSENDPSGSGYELSGLSCADSVKGGKPSSGDVGSRTASINLDPGETVTCTFTNTEDDTITVEKVTIPASSDSFGFGGTLGAFNVAGGSVQDFTNQAPGSYTISEDDPAGAGYVLTDISCVDSATGQTFAGDLTTRSVDLNLTAGERVHCTFTNSALGTIVINKRTSPANGTGFVFSGDLGAFTLDDGGSKLVANLSAGSYAVTEADPQGLGYKLSGLTCVDSVAGGTASSGDVAGRTATINLDPGETVTCNFTNTEDDTITIEKVTVPPSSDSFGFGGTLGAFNVAGGSVQDFTNQAPGSYTISEDDPAGAGYVLTDISCVDSATGQTFAGDLTTRSVDLNLTAGERVHCTFTNSALGTIVINKRTSPANGTGFVFSGDLGAFTLDDGGSKLVANLSAGSYAVTEADPQGLGYKLSGLTCVDSVAGGTASSGDVAGRTATINLDPGETVTCNFTNTEDDTITIEKVTVPPSSDSFGFDGTLGAFSVTAGGIQDFTGLTAGQYTISEDDPAAAGYELTDISCVDSATGQTFAGDLNSRSVDLNLVAGERVHCTFTNKRDVAPTPAQLFFPIIMGLPAPTPLFDNGFAAIPLRPATTGETFFDAPIVLNRATLPAGGRFYFSSVADRLEPMWVDDLIVVVSNGVDLFQYDFGAPPAGAPAISAAGILAITPRAVEVPRSVVEEMAAGGTTVEYRDFYGGLLGSSAVWLLWVP